MSVAPDGRYSIEGLAPGTYAITPNDGFHQFEPSAITIVVGAANLTGQDFTALPTGDGMTEAEQQIEDAAPEAIINPDEMILPDGQTLTQYRASHPASAGRNASHPASADRNKALAVGSLTGAAAVEEAVAVMLESAKDYACERSFLCKPLGKWNHDAEPDIVAVLGAGAASTSITYKRPNQVGLAYVFGGRNISARVRPAPVCSADNLLLYGTDCSGLISLVTQAAGISFKRENISVETQKEISNWDIPAAWGVEFKAITDGNYKAGDIVFMRGHVGIAWTDGRNPKVISSTGSGVTRSWCTNQNLVKGPRSVLLSNLPPAINKAFRLTPKEVSVAYAGNFSSTSTDTLTLNGVACTDSRSFTSGSANFAVVSGQPTLTLDYVQGASCGQGIALSVSRQATIPLTLSNGVYAAAVTVPFTCNGAYPCKDQGTQSYLVTLSPNVVVPGVYQTLKGSLEVGAQGVLLYDKFTVDASTTPVTYVNSFLSGYKVKADLEIAP